MSKSLVYKATSDDAKEPTGFALKELSQHSYTSLQASTELCELLVKRVEKDSADVKYKALKAIKYLCLHGRTEFRLDIQRDAAAIKQALHFRGNPDPLRGDAPNQRVRDEAKECMSAVFNGPAHKPGSGAATGRIEGYGGGGDSSLGSPTSEMTGGGRGSNHGYGEGTFSAGASSHHGHPSSSADSGSKMVGFGNPQYDNSKGRSSPSFLEKMKAKMAGTDGDPHAGRPTGPYRTYDRPVSTFQPPPIASIDATRKRGEVGGVWAGEDDHTPATFNAGGHSANGGVGSGNNNAYATHVPRAVRPTSSNGEYETRLIDSLTPAAGVRTQPTKDELQKFAAQCESLDKLLVVRLINEQKLVPDAHPATQMKALCLVECILTTGDATATEEVEDYLCENSTWLETIEKEGANAPLRNKAVRIMELCGLREEVRKTPAQVTGAPQTAAGTAAPASTSAFYSPNHAAHQQQQQQPKPEVDLLGFASAPAPVVGGASSSSAFDFVSGGGVDASNGGGDMFGSMEVKSTAVQAAPAQQPPQSQARAPPAASDDVFDLFASPTPAAAPASSAARPPVSAPAAAASASFDFMNPPVSSSTGGKVDPLTLLMSTAKISTQPRAPQGAMQQQQQPMPFGANGMAGFPPRQPMVPLGPGYPQQQQGYPQQGGFQPQGYPQQGFQPGYPQQQQGFPQQGYPQQQQQQPGFGGSQMGFGGNLHNGNANALFQVKAAGSGAQPQGLRPSIDLDPLGNPILASSSSSASAFGGAAGASPSAFGFVAAGGDSFGFVNDMMKK